ncbi:MAG: putative tricarboxylic transport rane protein [Thermosediminibacterales bacterium]|nr:putative tricarboxylic transport rane protein [Thermosediminibacterales bacterium]MDK2836280.1 putative tricarboxylic transport rane protein [Thermosediminibacterales bacterium]
MLQGLTALLNPVPLLMIFLGTILGISIGALPGLTATMGVALLVPLTFGLSPLVGLSLLAGIYCGAVYGGSISAILLGVPGTPAAVATMLDGHELTKQGQVTKALGAAVVASAIGGIFSSMVLLFAAPIIARFSLKFGPPEMFMLAVLGLTLIATLSGKDVVKGLIAGGLGLVISTTGIDPFTGTLRYAYGIPALYDGIPLTAALIGLFCFPQLIGIIEDKFKQASDSNQDIEIKGIAILPWQEIKRLWKVMLRCSIIGTIVGAIPGAGTDIAAFLGYSEAKRSSKYPEKFGTGIVDGVVGPETANNGVTGGSIIPLITLGIPGNAVSAVLLGGLLIQGLIPGQELFTKHATITYGFMFAMIVANICFLILGSTLIKYFGYVLKVPDSIIIPVIASLCVIGSYSIRNNLLDSVLAIILGIIAYFGKKLKVPMAPVCLALILGPLAESNLGRSLLMAQTKNINFFVFIFSRPIVLVLFAMAVTLLVTTYRMMKKVNAEAVSKTAGN